MRIGVTFLLAGIIGLLMARGASAGPIIGQVDDFEDGTTQGWIINLLGFGSPPPGTLPVNIPTGGPAGAGDNYLKLTSTGQAGPGGRLVTLNLDPRWTGNYLTSGVTGITMQVNNMGTTDLALRLYFERAVGGPPTDAAISLEPVIVKAGTGWQKATFLIDPAHLTPTVGNVNTALSNTTVLRLFNNPIASEPGPRIAAVLGVDNITAVQAVVPEPATLLTVAVGLLGLGANLRRRRNARATRSAA